jgi:DUF4097 and DUF4098 domain-containing protein YvlB
MVFLLGLAAAAYAGQDNEISKTFEGKKRLIIETVSGDCTIKAGSSNQIEVNVVHTYRDADCYEPIIRETPQAVRIGEEFYCNTRGDSRWTITVPADTKVRFSSASGNLIVEGGLSDVTAETASGNIDIEGFNGDLRIETASGDVNIQASTGELKVNAASGDITATNVSGLVLFEVASGNVDIISSEGTFDVGTASGDVRASQVVLDGISEFSTASGEAYVALGKAAGFDLLVSSASGDAIVNYSGNTPTGHFEFTAQADRGDIEAPFDFDEEEEFRQYRQTYLRKAFTRGDAEPRIEISTASGEAVLRLK